VPKRGERKLVNIYLNRELYLTAKADAARKDITMQEWMENAIKRELQSSKVKSE